MKVKLFLSILAFTAVFSNTAITQTDEARAKNSIYFELFGQGFLPLIYQGLAFTQSNLMFSAQQRLVIDINLQRVV